MLSFNKWKASLIFPDGSNAWNGEQIQEKMFFEVTSHESLAAQAGTTAAPRQGGV